MRIRVGLGVALLGLAFAGALVSGCSHHAPREKVWFPPRIDLAGFGTLGMIGFAAADPEGLGPIASREFLAALQSAQPGTPVLELGGAQRVFAQGIDALDPEAIRALGEQHRVDALVVGRVSAQPSTPRFAFDSAARWAAASAELEGTLEARIFDTRTGATVWTTSASASEPLARVDLSASGVSGLAPSSAKDANLRLVRRLVGRATADFWGHWE